MAILDCRTCGESFNTKFKMKKLGGYINECNDCALRSGDMKIKYVGRPGRSSKDSSITIMRTDLESARTQLRRENACGFGPNLGISHPVREHIIQTNKKYQGDAKFNTHQKKVKEGKDYDK